MFRILLNIIQTMVVVAIVLGIIAIISYLIVGGIIILIAIIAYLAISEYNREPGKQQHNAKFNDETNDG